MKTNSKPSQTEEKHIFAFYYDENINQNYVIIKHDHELFFRLNSVLKTRVGDRFIFFNQKWVFEVAVLALSKKEIRINILSQKEKVSPPKKITAYIPLLHKSYINDACYYCAQRGVTDIIFIKTDLSSTEHYSSQDIEKFRKLLIQGCQEGKQFILPSMFFTYQSLDSVIQQGVSPLYWFYEHGNKLNIQDNIQKAESYSFVCGPEKGFSNREILLLQNHFPHLSIKLNQYILRSIDIINFGTTLFSSL
jgi:RsmE family RNA methyltransferase